MKKIVLSCRLPTDVPVFSIYGHLWSGWKIVTYLRRSVHGWRLRREMLFPHMGGSIIYGLNLPLLLRRSTFALFDMYFIFYVSFMD
jgi:hypothetical protein